MNFLKKLPSISEAIRLGLLLLSSLLFYACFSQTLAALVCLLSLSALTWLGSLLASRSKHPAYPVSFTILLILVVWFLQKRSGIFLLGISFYSLQAIGYLLDVKNNICPVEKNPFILLLFLSFFPLSLQGPICRYNDFRQQITSFAHTSVTKQMFWQQCGSIDRILWGAFKKLVIADRIALMTTMIFQDPDVYQGFFVLFGLFAYTIQLYADFTGGIDIALGAARCLGFTLPENFDHPFLARSLAEYWRRWHITLGTWFRDYVFYPVTLSAALFLSARQKQGILKHLPVKQLSVWIATLLTWSLTGIWHGLAPRFLLWGLLNGGILLLSQSLEKRLKSPLTQKPFYPYVQMARTFLLVSLLRALDCYPTIRIAGRQLFSILIAPFDKSSLNNLSSLGDLNSLNNLNQNNTFLQILFPGLKTADLFLLLFCFAGYLIGRLLLSRFCSNHQVPAAFRYWSYPIRCVLLLFAILLFGIYGQGYDAKGFIYGGFV